jgi:hypothetical protein
VVPRTGRADLDDVKGDIRARPREADDLPVGREGATTGGESGTKRERHVDETGTLADRALDLCRLAEVLRDSQQLALGVADVDTREATLVELPNDRVAGKAILNLTKSGRGRTGSERRRADPHADRVSDGTSNQAARSLVSSCAIAPTSAGRAEVINIDVSNRYIG